MIDAGERAAMEATVREAIADALATAGDGADIDTVLAQLGWVEMLRDTPDAAIDIVFGALGAANATATTLDDVLASALGQEPRAGLAVVLPRFGAWDTPGRLQGNEIHATGLATARAAHAHELLVICAKASDVCAVLVPAATAEVLSMHGIDPHGSLHTIRVQGRGEGAIRLDPAAWSKAVALGQRAVAQQIAGACRAMLDLARTHALEREQFGRPIARFQAVRHRLAEVLVAVEALDATLVAARDDPGSETAALAKAVAGRASRTVSRNCQQVLAGIGFTTEHRFHRFLKRTMALEGLFGSADDIVLDIGRRLLSTRNVPTLIEL
jgi:hypothetical protein